MAWVKLVGGFADGSVASVAAGQDAIYVPKQWGRQGHKGSVTRDQMRDYSDMVKYVRSGRCDDDGTPIFVPEGSGLY